MKYSLAALALLTAPFASAGALVERRALIDRGTLIARRVLNGRSDLTELPNCAQNATEAGISATGCSISNFQCICGNSQFVTSLHSLIDQSCDIADQEVTLAFAEQICGAVGVQLNIPTPPSTTSSSIVPSTTPTSVPSAIETASATSSISSSATVPTPTPSAPYGFANGSTGINGTNSTTPFEGGAAERGAMGLQLAGSALAIAVVMGIFL